MGEFEKFGPSAMSSNKKPFLRLIVVLAVTTEVIHAFPGVGFPFSKPQPQNDVLSVLMERELCSAESLAKMSSVCRIICQTPLYYPKWGKEKHWADWAEWAKEQ